MTGAIGPSEYSRCHSFLEQLFVTKTSDGVVVDQADRLHEGIADRRADEREAPPLEVSAHRIGFLGSGGNLLQFLPFVHNGLAVYELPDVPIKGAKFLLDSKERLGVLDGACNFKPVPDDAVVLEQLSLPPPVIAGHFSHIKAIEGCTIIFPLAKNCVPTQSRLCSLKDQELKKHTIVVLGNTPLKIVVTNGNITPRPATTDELSASYARHAGYCSDFGSE